MTTISMHAPVNSSSSSGGKLTTSSSSAGTVNVIRGLDDPFYRYRMETLRTKIEGNGNGIKTVLTNMDNIGKSLNRPPSYPTKYFGCELGAQTRFDDKTARYIVNGAHEAGKLSELLDEFIKKFVLCPSCNNPETDLIIDKNNDIIRVCKACGQRHLVDMRHKLTTFIVNNPPPGAKKESSTKKSSKELKKKEKREKTSSSTTHHDGKKRHESGSEEEPDIEAPTMLDQRETDDDTWGDDLVDEEAVQRRAKEMDSINDKLERCHVNASGSDEDTKDPTEHLFNALVQHKQSQEAILREIEASGLVRHDKISLVLASALLDDDQLSTAWILKYIPLLKQYATDPKSQRNILIGMERALVHRMNLVAKVPIFFKIFYDQDLVDEEVFLKWSKKLSSRRYVPRDVTKLIHEKAQVFIQWLETAEEESSSSGEEED